MILELAKELEERGIKEESKKIDNLFKDVETKSNEKEINMKATVLKKEVVKKEAPVQEAPKSSNADLMALLQKVVAEKGVDTAKELASLLQKTAEPKKEAGVNLRDGQKLIGVVDKSSKTGIVITTYDFKDVKYVDIRNHYFNTTGSTPAKGIAIPVEHLASVYEILGKYMNGVV